MSGSNLCLSPALRSTCMFHTVNYGICTPTILIVRSIHAHGLLVTPSLSQSRLIHNLCRMVMSHRALRACRIGYFRHACDEYKIILVCRTLADGRINESSLLLPLYHRFVSDPPPLGLHYVSMSLSVASCALAHSEREPLFWCFEHHVKESHASSL